MTQQAVLALADGSVFHGQGIGSAGETSGEVVFNTSMTGYQEILTDPSYAKQLVTLTFPILAIPAVIQLTKKAIDPWQPV